MFKLARTKSDSVLVIENDRDGMDAIVDALELDGYRCVNAANGRDALAYLEGGLLPEVILLELSLPGMNADQFLAVRNRRALAGRAKVVLMSGANELERRAAELRAAGWLPKPIQLEALLRMVRRLTAR